MFLMDTPSAEDQIEFINLINRLLLIYDKIQATLKIIALVSSCQLNKSKSIKQQSTITLYNCKLLLISQLFRYLFIHIIQYNILKNTIVTFMNVKSHYHYQQIKFVMIIGFQIHQHVDSNIQKKIQFKIVKFFIVLVILKTQSNKMMIQSEIIQSPLWYSSYKISQFIIQYNITISISYSLNLTQQFNLGSEIQEQKDQNIFAKIVSGFSPQQQPPVLENLYFMKPSLLINHNGVQIGSEAYMPIPQELVGQGDCNKIGVSYSSFKNQTQKCKILMQSCLQNQIEDLYQNDLELIANNSQPQYLIFKYGQFKQTNINDDLFLQFTFDESMTTSIELFINNANDITYIKDIKESEKGQIDLVEIHNFSAASGFGSLYAQITNIGEIFLNCFNNTQTIYSTDLSLDPQKSKIVQQDINFSTQIRESNSCNFSLLNNEGSHLDWKTIYFDELNDNNQKSNSSFNFKENTCDSKCSPFFDIYCYFQYKCESYIITFFTVLSGIFITICFCCIYLGYKKKLSCCQFKKQLQNNTSPLESFLYQQNKELKRRIKLSDSYQESYCQQQILILSVSQDEGQIQFLMNSNEMHHLKYWKHIRRKSLQNYQLKETVNLQKYLNRFMVYKTQKECKKILSSKG
ncbi:unnamed protein product [Paramecium sonneborni]|uniref:Generative cell specific-1/HAP2 domain-containing protein n=1 Tax=Paramecium sonneborni TaxID=65129 RepID=A0A8S1RTD7_9CILI|nr:unnamed protein product [Paramecium sonneborni]